MTTRVKESLPVTYEWTCDVCGFQQDVPASEPDKEWLNVSCPSLGRHFFVCPACATTLPDWLVR